MSAVNFRISISYPPLKSSKGTPFLSQNRQFQWTNTGNIIYPVIPAQAATLLSKSGYQVFWDDAIAENISFSDWLNRLKNNQPNLIAIETKTPVVKKHWQIIKTIKNISTSKWHPIVVLMGDHVTALPQESIENSLVDYILTGGDYDFMLKNLADHLFKKSKLEPGFWYKKSHKIINTGSFGLKHHNLDELPIIDRDLTKWRLYAYNNNNYRYTPGAYIMSGRDCWWGKCTFCSWTTIYPGSSFRHFSVSHTINEIQNLVTNYQVKEIFDDSGTLPIGSWLQDFCHQMIKTGLNQKVKISCNMRFGALNQDQYNLLAKAGFRFILYGFESANQRSLDLINKNNRVENSTKDLIMVKKAGLHPHITIMIGYPWESKKEVNNTINYAKNLFRQGLLDSMQATIVIPYPGTPLFKYCHDKKLLLTTDWDNYDMRQPIMKSQLTPLEQKTLVQSLFIGIITPKFILNQFISIRTFSDIKYYLKFVYKFFKKLKDFQHL